MSDKSLHEQLIEAHEAYLAEAERFDEKGVKGASSKARSALSNYTKIAKERRKEIQEKRNSL